MVTPLTSLCPQILLTFLAGRQERNYSSHLIELLWGGVLGDIPRADMRPDGGVKLTFRSPLSSLGASKPSDPFCTGGTAEVPPTNLLSHRKAGFKLFQAQSQLNWGPAWRQTDTRILLLDWATSCTGAPSGALNPERQRLWCRQRRESSGLFNALLLYCLANMLLPLLWGGEGLCSVHQSWGPQARKTKCTHIGTRGCSLCPQMLIYPSKGFLENHPPLVFVYSSLTT